MSERLIPNGLVNTNPSNADVDPVTDKKTYGKPPGDVCVHPDCDSKDLVEDNHGIRMCNDCKTPTGQWLTCKGCGAHVSSTCFPGYRVSALIKENVYCCSACAGNNTNTDNNTTNHPLRPGAPTKATRSFKVVQVHVPVNIDPIGYCQMDGCPGQLVGGCCDTCKVKAASRIGCRMCQAQIWSSQFDIKPHHFVNNDDHTVFCCGTACAERVGKRPKQQQQQQPQVSVQVNVKPAVVVEEEEEEEEVPSLLDTLKAMGADDYTLQQAGKKWLSGRVDKYLGGRLDMLKLTLDEYNALGPRKWKFHVAGDVPYLCVVPSNTEFRVEKLKDQLETQDNCGTFDELAQHEILMQILDLGVPGGGDVADRVLADMCNPNTPHGAVVYDLGNGVFILKATAVEGRKQGNPVCFDDVSFVVEKSKKHDREDDDVVSKPRNPAVIGITAVGKHVAENIGTCPATVQGKIHEILKDKHVARPVGDGFVIGLIDAERARIAHIKFHKEFTAPTKLGPEGKYRVVWRKCESKKQAKFFASVANNDALEDNERYKALDGVKVKKAKVQKFAPAKQPATSSLAQKGILSEQQQEENFDNIVDPDFNAFENDPELQEIADDVFPGLNL